MQITSDDLYEYGKWARDDNNRLCPKSQWHELIMKGNVMQSSTDITYNISDDKAAKIDKAVCALSKYSDHLGKLFYQHYVLDMSYRALAKENKCSRNAIAADLDKAGGFVIGAVTST